MTWQLVVEAERQRKYTWDIHETEAIVTAVPDPRGTVAHSCMCCYSLNIYHAQAKILYAHGLEVQLIFTTMFLKTIGLCFHHDFRHWNAEDQIVVSNFFACLCYAFLLLIFALFFPCPGPNPILVYSPLTGGLLYSVSRSMFSCGSVL